ncbi:hypothetical protein P152DRAFT_406648 [Eremomyces bilateralis CBS 781.70]|uniref:Uncharacterized protein n=1 Tax=Eremomyces bilateralis CBS 781.70 TaxID=1392243 RepID=A0A6G1FQ46_9PEZI|nr:uncharacterized protein P152DRAFT_406648 [Eremomyces bilateralis CBS 781.70]KAF1807866.1 hypothetical protein P152DRAFT_406648 [Eremomyces bilateralis CBS 781.70]
MTIQRILNRVKVEYQPTGTAVFISLDRRFNSLSLSDCKDVMDFAQQLRKARNKLLQLHKSVTLGDPFLIIRFLEGLGPNYAIFRTSFYQNYPIIPATSIKDGRGSLTVKFDDIILLASKEEDGLKQEESRSALLTRRGQDKNQKPNYG